MKETRDFCPRCAIKHLGQAGILFKEVQKGYPHHIWYGMAHMAEAEDEIIEFMPDEANAIRELRKAVEENKVTKAERAKAITDLMYKVAKGAMLIDDEGEAL